MIPRNKTWTVKFYKDHSRPYAVLRVWGPTKFLAKLNARTLAEFWKALGQGPTKITWGLVREGRKVAK